MQIKLISVSGTLRLNDELRGWQLSLSGVSDQAQTRSPDIQRPTPNGVQKLDAQFALDT